MPSWVMRFRAVAKSGRFPCAVRCSHILNDIGARISQDIKVNFFHYRIRTTSLLYCALTSVPHQYMEAANPARQLSLEAGGFVYYIFH